MTGVCIKRGNLQADIHTHTQKMVRGHVKVGVMVSQVKKLPEAGKEAQNRSCPSAFFRGNMVLSTP